jgi:ArsR family transcriptional regulator
LSGELAEVFRALSHPMRVRVIELLADGPVSVRELRARTCLDSSALAAHLTVLRRCGLVAAQRRGRDTEYALGGPEVVGLARCGRDVLARRALGHEQLLAGLRREQAS